MLSQQPRTLTELAALQGVSLPTMSNSISAMVDRGWVRRTAPTSDRRVVIIEITATGKSAVERVGRSAEAHLADVARSTGRGVAQETAGGTRRPAQGLHQRAAGALEPELNSGRIYDRRGHAVNRNSQPGYPCVQKPGRTRARRHLLARARPTPTSPHARACWA